VSGHGGKPIASVSFVWVSSILSCVFLGFPFIVFVSRWLVFGVHLIAYFSTLSATLSSVGCLSRAHLLFSPCALKLFCSTFPPLCPKTVLFGEARWGLGGLLVYPSLHGISQSFFRFLMQLILCRFTHREGLRSKDGHCDFPGHTLLPFRTIYLCWEYHTRIEHCVLRRLKQYFHRICSHGYKSCKRINHYWDPRWSEFQLWNIFPLYKFPQSTSSKRKRYNNFTSSM